MSLTLSATALPWALMGLVLFALAAVIWFRQRSSRVAVLFCAMIVLVAIWFAAFALQFSTADPTRAEDASRLALMAIALMPATVYDFTITALRLGRRRGVARVIWLTATIFALFVLFSDFIVSGLSRFSWGFYPRVGILGIPFVAWFAAVMLWNLVEYAREYRRTDDPTRRERIVELFIGFFIVYWSAVDFVAMFGHDQRPRAWIPVLAFVLFAARGIRRHRLRAITAARASREILETMADALFVLDAEGHIRVINGAVRNLFGYSDAEIVGKSMSILEDADETIARTLRSILQRGTVRDHERIFRAKSGERVDVSISISPVHEDDVEEGAVVIARDIRERKRAEEERQAFMESLQQSNRELEDFAYVASHDLQEPLRKIQAFGDRLRTKYGEQLAAEGLDYLARMQGAANRMQRLINDLLAFSRVTTKAQPFAPVDLRQVAADVVHDLEMRLHDTGGEVVVGELPTIDADPLQIRQLLQNLVGNALKFHRPGVPPHVEISGGIVHAPRADGNGGRCEIVVRDNGIGFEEKYADRIFTMFERLHGRGTYEGTGIGLAICRKIAQRHHGEITARSSPGAGAMFVVTLPVKH